MSVVDGRSAPDHPMSLLEHATRLYERHPDGPLPDGGCPYPDDDTQPDGPRRRIPVRERKAKLSSLLEAFFADPSAEFRDLHDGLCQLEDQLWSIESAVAELSTVDADHARRTGSWLVKHATDRRPAMVGLGLLAKAATPDDVPVVRMLGLLELFAAAAVKVLATIPGTAADLIWLAERSEEYARGQAVEALCQQADPGGVAWLLRHAIPVGGELSASRARQVAETISLADVLEAANVEADVLDQAGRLLLAMVSPNDYRAQLADYRDAGRAYRCLVGHLTRAPASMERLAMLVSLGEELRTGHAACLAWVPDERRRIVDELYATVRRDDWRAHLDAALESADPLVRRRGEWAEAAISAASPIDVPGLHIRVVTPDPCRRSEVETRVLVDGVPVLPAAFDKGPPESPEVLLGRGELRAAAEPHEVRLAEAYCTEGCCGALYVSIARDGDSVVWRDWRGHTSEAPPPEVRFPAERYDAEVARAEQDFAWEWPARTLARLLRARVLAEPELLARWQCHLWFLGARADEPSHVRLSFGYPELVDPLDGQPWLQFERVITVDHTPVADQAARIVEQLHTVDPKTQAVVVGGHRDHAERLGYPQY